jgi:hypothetical protein
MLNHEHDSSSFFVTHAACVTKKFDFKNSENTVRRRIFCCNRICFKNLNRTKNTDFLNLKWPELASISQEEIKKALQS